MIIWTNLVQWISIILFNTSVSVAVIVWVIKNLRK